MSTLRTQFLALVMAYRGVAADIWLLRDYI